MISFASLTNPHPRIGYGQALALSNDGRGLGI